MKIVTILTGILNLIGVKSDIISVGDQRDEYGCLMRLGYSWCESSYQCIRKWETPCSSDYNDCPDCLQRQRNGENIACPLECDLVSINDPCSLGCPFISIPCPPPLPNCEYIPSPQDNCGCSIGCGTISCPPRPDIEPPYNCEIWYDGCNTCSIKNGNIQTCTMMGCLQKNEPYCKSYINNGH